MKTNTAILVIYTGGTIGMIMDKETGVLIPFNFDNLYHQIPALELFNFVIDHYCFDPVIDSSNMDPVFWAKLAGVIEEHYERYDGFVVLHGSDTMAFTASALSFMLQNLNKPVILTGSQLPLGTIRSDGRENFITAVEIAAAKTDDTPVVPEVCIYFENRLLRGNRTRKVNAEHFGAFKSVNYPALAEVGVHIRYNHNAIRKPNFRKLKVYSSLNTEIAIVKLFPGINAKILDAILSAEGLRAIILETFGAGNAPDAGWFIDLLHGAITKGIIVLNITQCQGGAVEMGKYATSARLREIGVISGGDMTPEAAVAKLMYLLGNFTDMEEIKRLLTKPLAGEISEQHTN
ncbi:MAG: asparaginase [Bacteroidales bacterium]|nr:asparaginase [Bacteroidales bacterium]